MESFIETRSRNAIIKRMIELGLIADRSEVMPSRKKRSKKSVPENSDGEASEQSDDDSDQNSDSEMPSRPVKIKIKRITTKKSKETKKAPDTRKVPKIILDVANVLKIMAELDENDKANLEWIQESLNDAAEDMEEPSDDPEDGVPLVPFTAQQRDSFENDMFQELLKALGFQEPVKEMVISNSIYYIFGYFKWSFNICRKHIGESR